MHKFLPRTFQQWFEVFLIGGISIATLVTVVLYILDNVFLTKHSDSIARSCATSINAQVCLLQDGSTISFKNSSRTVQYDLQGKKFERVALSPNGTNVLLVTRESRIPEVQSPQFWIFNLETKKLTMFPIGGYNPSFLNDDAFAYDLKDRVYVTRLSDPDQVINLVSGTRPSGFVGKNSFAYETKEHQLAIFRIETLESILLPIPFKAFSPAVSPDGELIAFLTASEEVGCTPFCNRNLWVYQMQSRYYWPVHTSGNKAHPVWISNQSLIAQSDQDLFFLAQYVGLPMYEFDAKGTHAPTFFTLYP